jgi:hypothetical protein
MERVDGGKGGPICANHMGLPLGERPAAAAAAPAAAPADEIDVERLLTASLDANRFRHERNRYLRKGRPAIAERPSLAVKNDRSQTARRSPWRRLEHSSLLLIARGEQLGAMTRLRSKR